MTTIRRWLVVLAGIALLAALPSVVAALPATPSDLSAAELLRRITASTERPYSGYAEATGGLALPVTSQFTSVADLFGGRTQLRAWYRTGTTGGSTRSASPASPTSTTTHPATGAGTTSPTPSTAPAHRSRPRCGCRPPPTWCRRSWPAGCSARRCRAKPPGWDPSGSPAAAHRACGSPRTSRPADRAVDVWADAADRAAAAGPGAGQAVRQRGAQQLLPRLLPAEPPASVTAFSPPSAPGSQPAVPGPGDRHRPARRGGATGPAGRPGPQPAAAAVRQRRGVRAGCDRAGGGAAARPDRLLALPELAKVTGADPAEPQLTVTVGPLTLLLVTPTQRDASWLLVGTVTEQMLAAAAAQLPAHPGLD